MPAPTKYFAHIYDVSFNSNTGVYRVTGSIAGAYATVQDNVVDSTPGHPDSNAQLGDVTNDKYTYVSNGITFNGQFRASNAAGNFIGSYAGGGPYSVTITPGNLYLYTNSTYTNGPLTGFSSARPEALCFVSGTLIRTTRGEIAVESLAVGDIAVTASGAHRPIRWLGHRDVDCAAHETPSQVWPVRILAGAFGAGVPARDLYLSPGHPILVGADEDGEGGHLVPAMCLINGTTIDRMEMDNVTYWHVELDEHDIILAEGLPAESYLDWGDRAFFSEAAEHALMNPDFVVPGLAGRCRPVALDGPVVEAERQRLDGVLTARLSGACAWPSPDLLAIF